MSGLAWIRGAELWLAVGAAGGVCLVALVVWRLAKGEHVEPGGEEAPKGQRQDSNDK